MHHFGKIPLTAACASLLMAASLLAGNVQAAEEEQEKSSPLQFYTGANGSYAKATIEANLGFFGQGNSWFGNSAANLGSKSDSWWESLVRPGIDAKYVLPNSQTLYGNFDLVQANTFGGVDGSGTNGPKYMTDEDVNDLRIDRAYAGWRSGTLFKSLGEDFLDVSFGRQRYIYGDGFLLGSEGGSGFNRASYWIGGRNTADYMGIVRMKTGNWASDLIYFQADDIAKTDTTLGGGNLTYSVEKIANLGGGFYVVNSDDNAARDGMNVYNIRGGINPFAFAKGPDVLKPLRFDAEFVHEDAAPDFTNGEAWSVAVSYQFENTPWKPTLTYRYASFEENYDLLFYGSTDWGTWYQGEILGEYVLWNNIDSHMLRLKMQPIEPVTVNLIYYKFLVHDTDTAGVTNDSYADEFDLIVDWTVNDHLTLSVVGAIANPDTAATEMTGGNDNWSYVMLFGAVKF